MKREEPGIQSDVAHLCRRRSRDDLQERDLKLNVKGDDVRLLQAELTQIGLPVSNDERKAARFEKGTRDAVVRFQKEHQLEPTGVVDAATATAINEAVAASTRYTVAGTVASPDRAEVGGLRVEIVDNNVGKDVPLAEAGTDERGRFSACFSTLSLREWDKTEPDLEAAGLQRVAMTLKRVA